MKVLSIGKSCFEITSILDKDIIVGGNNYLNSNNTCGGGSASNVAFLLGKWGVDVSIAALVGSDSYAETIKKELSSVNVNTNFLETNFEQSTNLRFITINNQSKDRTIYNISNEYKPLKKYNYDFTPDIIFSDGYDYGATQNAVNKYTQAMNFLDAREVTNETMELSKYMKNIIASSDFAVSVTGINIDYENSSTLVNLYTKLSSKYPNANIIITLGNHGALYKNANEIKIMPGLNMEVTDTTGSKDAFIAAYIYSLVNNFDVEKTVSLANIAAGLVAKSIGGRNSMPALSDVLDVYNQKLGGNQAATTQAPAQDTQQAPAPAQNTEITNTEAPSSNTTDNNVQTEPQPTATPEANPTIPNQQQPAANETVPQTNAEQNQATQAPTNNETPSNPA